MSKYWRCQSLKIVTLRYFLQNTLHFAGLTKRSTTVKHYRQQNYLSILSLDSLSFTKNSGAQWLPIQDSE